MGIFWLHSFTHLVYLVAWVSVYLEGQDVCDLIIFGRAVWCGDIRVTAAADSGLEEHVANCGCRCPTHGAVTAFCWGYHTSRAWDGRQIMKYHVILKICAPSKNQRIYNSQDKVNKQNACKSCQYLCSVLLEGSQEGETPSKGMTPRGCFSPAGPCSAPDCCEDCWQWKPLIRRLSGPSWLWNTYT